MIFSISSLPCLHRPVAGNCGGAVVVWDDSKLKVSPPVAELCVTSYNMGIKTYIQNLRCQNRENGVQDISFAAYGRKKAVSLKNTERHSCLLSKLCRCFDI